MKDSIIKLFSAYDKTYHILNSLFNLNIDSQIEKGKFKEKVREGIKQIDKKMFKKINSIFSRIEADDLIIIMDNIIYNKSLLFVRIEFDSENELTNLKLNKEMKIEEIIILIENFTNLLEEQLNVIKTIIKEKIFFSL